MKKDFLQLKEDIGKLLPYILPNGLNWRLEYIKPDGEENGYYHFYECKYIKGNVKSYSGISSPDYDYFKEELLNWIKMYERN